MPKPKVAFICVHNSCRSQMAKPWPKNIIRTISEAYSAGTGNKTTNQSRCSPTSKRKASYRYGKGHNILSYLMNSPPIDIVITMGCNVDCPYLPCHHREDLGFR